jgi:hypothetical protein
MSPIPGQYQRYPSVWQESLYLYRFAGHVGDRHAAWMKVLQRIESTQGRSLVVLTAKCPDLTLLTEGLVWWSSTTKRAGSQAPANNFKSDEILSSKFTYVKVISRC